MIWNLNVIQIKGKLKFVDRICSAIALDTVVDS